MASATEGGGPLPDLSELERPGVDAASHLIVIAHGMWGTPYDVGYMAKQLKAKLPHSIIHVSEVRICGQSLCSPIVGLNVYYSRHDGFSIMASSNYISSVM